MLEIKEKVVREISVEKSRFIAIAMPFSKEEDLKKELNLIKKEYRDARHYTYAYLVGEKAKFSDDGEPSGTAGKPIYELIKFKNVTNILIVVVRYFGGTLLGAGRLLRSYKEAALLALNDATKVEIIKMKQFEILVEYETYDTLKNYLINKQFIIKKTEFNDKIYILCINEVYFNEDIQSLFYGKVEIINTEEILYRKEV